MKKKSILFRVTGPLLLALLLFINNTSAQSGVVLYGMTYSGGPYNLGTVFKCSGSGTFDTLVSFNDSNGANPYGNLIRADDGNLYGMTLNGGIYDLGLIFKMSLSGVLDTFATFNDTNGANPYGSLFQARDGNFYGMTYNGGIYASCVFFKCSKGGVVDILFDFLGPTGDFPYGNVMQGTDGNLYGMTTGGGNNSIGTFFVKAPGDTLTKLNDFNDTNGAMPYGSLIQATDGNFYGMSSDFPIDSGIFSGIADSTAKYGNIFRANTAGDITTIYVFDSIHGKAPMGSLIQANDGNLYGMTSEGGAGKNDTSYGTIFVCTLSGNLTTLVKFNYSNGANPNGSLIQASDGNLYGMTLNGGKYGYGTIFKCTLNGTLTTLVDFDSTKGSHPYGDLLEVDAATGINTLVNNYNAYLYPNPNNGKFTVFVNGLSDKAYLSIYNMLGENIYSSPVYNGSTHINTGINANGIYLYRIVTNGALIKEGKIVIN